MCVVRKTSAVEVHRRGRGSEKESLREQGKTTECSIEMVNDRFIPTKRYDDTEAGRGGGISPTQR